MGFLFGGGSDVTTRADKVSTFQATSCSFGTPLKIAYGTCKLSPNLINYMDFYSDELVTTTKTGKNSSSTSYNYKYYVYVELALCEGVIGGLGKVWAGNNTYGSLGSLNNSGNEGRGLSLNYGNNASPTAYMQSHHPSIAVGYANMAYLYGVIYLGKDSASMPSYSFEVYGSQRGTGDGVDANPADVIIDLLTRVGMGSKIDTTSFANYRAFCRNADLLISTPASMFESQTQCQEIINSILTITNAYMFWSVDRFKIVPRETHSWGSWSPNNQIIYDLDEDNFLPQGNGVCIKYQRKDSSEQYNRFGVSFINRANNYENETVFFEDVADIQANGLKANSTVDGSWLHTKSRAIRVAEMLSRVNKYENIKYTFKLGWAFGMLEAGDLVTLTDSSIGLNKQVVMIESVTEDSLGRLTVTALSREPGNYKSALYGAVDDYNEIDFNIIPANTAQPVFILPPQSLITSPSGLEIWMALHGEQSTWGGCDVYVSDQDGEYRLNGRQPRSSIFGYTLTAMNADTDTVDIKLTNPNTVELLTGSSYDAANDNTLVYIGGEFMSYTNAQVIGANEYRLSGLVRGKYGKATSHQKGEDAVSCDGGLYVIQVPKQYLDRTLYFKYPAFNIFGANHQDINGLTYYTQLVTGKVTLPADVEMLDTEVLADGTRRFWWAYDYPSTNDIAGFKLKYIQGSYPQWANAYELHTGLVTSQPFETNALRQGTHTVMIKAVDTLGQESEHVAYTTLNLGDLLEENVLYKEDLSRDQWNHTNNNGVIDASGNLVAKSNTAFWTVEDGLFWPAPFNNIWESTYSNFNLVYQMNIPASGQWWLDYDIQGPAKIEYLICGKDNFWGNYTSGHYWGEKQKDIYFNVENNLYKPYTCKVLFNAGEDVQIRVYSDANATEPTIVKALNVIVDVPDCQEHFENVSVPIEGRQLNIKTPYYYTTAVRIDAVQGIGANVFRAVIVEKNPCVIKLIDVNYEPVAAVVDVTWQGFSKEVIE